jgi:hypothetical protein
MVADRTGGFYECLARIPGTIFYGIKAASKGKLEKAKKPVSLYQGRENESRL